MRTRNLFWLEGRVFEIAACRRGSLFHHQAALRQACEPCTQLMKNNFWTIGLQSLRMQQPRTAIILAVITSHEIHVFKRLHMAVFSTPPDIHLT